MSADETPEVELTCRECGEPLTYIGGRKPTVCRKGEGCRTASKAVVTPGKSGVKGADAALVSQAVNTLMTVNSVLSMLSLATGLFSTATAINDAEDVFRAQLTSALSQDLRLCRKIVGSGSSSGAIVGLVIAYGTLGASVVPTAVVELRERRERAEVQSGTDGTEDSSQG